MKRYTELLTIPLAVILLMLYNHVAEKLGMFVFTWEMFGKVFVAFLLFLVALGFVRLLFMFMFPIMYRYFDLSFSYSRLGWNQLEEWQRLLYSTALFVALLLAFVVILNGL
jgi:hypothetical protein